MYYLIMMLYISKLIVPLINNNCVVNGLSVLNTCLKKNYSLYVDIVTLKIMKSSDQVIPEEFYVCA